MNLLCLTLAVTPLRRLAGWHWLAPLRRLLGLFAFFYLVLHLITYLWLDQFFDWPAIGKDILKRPFITIGMLVFVLLVPLALTSTASAVRRLGMQRWRQLHRLIYPAALLAVLHYTWMVKLDVFWPAVYFGVVAALLGFRLMERLRPMRAPPGGTVGKAAPRRRIIPIQPR